MVRGCITVRASRLHRPRLMLCRLRLRPSLCACPHSFVTKAGAGKVHARELQQNVDNTETWTIEQGEVVEACLALRSAMIDGRSNLMIIGSAPGHVQHIFTAVKCAEEAHALAEEALLGLNDLRELWARGLAAQQVVAAQSEGWQGGKGEKTRALNALHDALVRTRVQVGISALFAGRSRVPLLSESAWTGAVERQMMQLSQSGDEGEGDVEDEERPRRGRQ